MRDERDAIRLPGGGTSNGESGEIILAHLIKKDLQLSKDGGGTTLPATVAVHAKLVASAPFEPLIPFDAITDAGIFHIGTSVYSIKLVVSGYTSGTLIAAYAGFNPQQG